MWEGNRGRVDLVDQGMVEGDTGVDTAVVDTAVVDTAAGLGMVVEWDKQLVAE